MEECFPESNLDYEYLDWLYFSNPLGDVVGYNAYENSKLISHYACIPIRVGSAMGLLSVNTATHPEFRSKGLYRSLASLTYESASEDYDFVIGVANALSAPVFIKHLGFREIGRVNLRFGRISSPTGVTRTWDRSTLAWRLASPKTLFKERPCGIGLKEISISPHRFPFKICSVVALKEFNGPRENKKGNVLKYGFTIDWRRNSRPFIQLPARLKPSPLVLIIRNLTEVDLELDSWSFIDFDAY